MKEYKTAEEYDLSPEEVDELKKRAISDRICRVMYNRYKSEQSNPFIELYNTVNRLLKTQVTDKLQDESFRVTPGSFTESLMNLFDSMPKIVKGVGDLKETAYGGGGEKNNPEAKGKDIISAVMGEKK